MGELRNYFAATHRDKAVSGAGLFEGILEKNGIELDFVKILQGVQKKSLGI